MYNLSPGVKGAYQAIRDAGPDLIHSIQHSPVIGVGPGDTITDANARVAGALLSVLFEAPQLVSSVRSYL